MAEERRQAVEVPKLASLVAGLFAGITFVALLGILFRRREEVRYASFRFAYLLNYLCEERGLPLLHFTSAIAPSGLRKRVATVTVKDHLYIEVEPVGYPNVFIEVYSGGRLVDKFVVPTDRPVAKLYEVSGETWIDVISEFYNAEVRLKLVEGFRVKGGEHRVVLSKPVSELLRRAVGDSPVVPIKYSLIVVARHVTGSVTVVVNDEELTIDQDNQYGYVEIGAGEAETVTIGLRGDGVVELYVRVVLHEAELRVRGVVAATPLVFLECYPKLCSYDYCNCDQLPLYSNPRMEIKRDCIPQLDWPNHCMSDEIEVIVVPVDMPDEEMQSIGSLWCKRKGTPPEEEPPVIM